MDELYYDAIDLLKSMIAVPSVSRDESMVADVVEAYVKSKGYEVYRKGNNVWTICPDFDATRPTLLLNSHIDTVAPVSGWSRNPFEPVEDDDRIYGLGSNDAGASVVSLFAAFRYVTSVRQQYNTIFLASCEEEVSGKNGVESVLSELPHVTVAVVGEPTGMCPAIAEKGLLVLDGVIRGKSGHAARNEGVNAIYKAMNVIEKLQTLHFEKESAMLGPVKISVTQIESGTAHNIVPDMCKIVVDVRTIDAYSNVDTLEYIKTAISECEFKERSTRLNPSGIDRSHPIVTRAEMLGLKPFGSPTLSDQALMPFPSIKMGPGDSGRSHTADEYICVDEIREAIEIYIKIFSGLEI